MDAGFPIDPRSGYRFPRDAHDLWTVADDGSAAAASQDRHALRLARSVRRAVAGASVPDEPGAALLMRPPTLNLVPEYPPRVRVEWLIAISRIVLAAGALLARCGEPGRRAGRLVAGLRARLVPALQRPRARPGVDAGALRARLGRRAARLRSRRLFALQLLHRQRHQSVLRLFHLPGDLRHAALGDAAARCGPPS